MSKITCKALLHLRSAVRIWQVHGICLFQIHPYSTSLQSVENSPNQCFAAAYLVNSCGFSLERALWASRYLKFQASDKPDSVIALFESHGFTKCQIERLVSAYPRVLLCHPEKTLLPKLEFFKSKGWSSADVAHIFSRTPSLLTRSLEHSVIPSIEFINNLLQSEKKTVHLLKRFGSISWSDLITCLPPNIKILQDAGVPDKNISFLLTQQPRVLIISSQKFREVVKGVEKMGFNPLLLNFTLAVHALRSMAKSTWKRKLEVYKKWGLSEEDTLLAFRRLPWCMTASEDKIMRVMNYLVNKMGRDSSFVVRRPTVICHSLEARVIPRCTVYEVLLSKVLIKDSDARLFTILHISEERLLKLLNSYKEEAPELLKLYEEKLALAKKIE